MATGRPLGPKSIGVCRSSSSRSSSRSAADYNILLVTRPLEEAGAARPWKRECDACPGADGRHDHVVRHHHGGDVCDADAGELNTLIQIGFVLAFGVLLDTFIVRPLLVPAFAMLFWKDEPPGTVVQGRHGLRVAQYRKAS